MRHHFWALQQLPRCQRGAKYTAEQRQTTVTAYLKSKQLLLFAFSRRHTPAEDNTDPDVSLYPDLKKELLIGAE